MSVSRFNFHKTLALVLAISLSPRMIVSGETNAAANTTPASGSPATKPQTAAATDLLQFLDGGSLHGQLSSMDKDQGVQWQHPAAKKAIKFKPTNLAWIKFENAERVASAFKPTCWFQFSNGDEIFGSLKAMDETKLELETWFGGNLQAPRQTLQSVTFFAKGFSILYDGPKGVDGWKFLQDAKGWQYRDGGFVANGVGTLGRDLHLSGSSMVEFDLAWSGHFNLSFILFTEVFDRFDYSISSYMFHLAPGYLTLQRVQAGAGVMSLGPQAQIPSMLRKNKTRVEIRVNKEEAMIGVWADGELVYRWKDPSGFVAKGSGIVFSSQMDGPAVRLSNIKASEWDGTWEPRALTNAPLSADLVYLANRDKVSGNLKSIRDGKITFAIPQTNLDIPLERVTQIVLNQPDPKPRVSEPWEIRVDVSGGGTVGFQLDKWSGDRVTGTSANFGAMTVNPQSIRQIQFNSGRPSKAAAGNGLGGEDTWEIDDE
jgi:hypothetical protein